MLLPPALLLLQALTASSSADPRAVRLEYARIVGAERCPAEAVLREAVAARLGYDPFRPDATRTLALVIGGRSSDGDGLRATIVLTGPDEKPRTREIDSPAGDCVELASALELALSIAIDPLLLVRPPSPPKIETVVVLAPPSPPPRPPAPLPPSPPPKASPSYLASLGVQGAVASAPAPTLGLNLGLEVRWVSFSLGVEGRADLPAGVSVGMNGGSVNAALLVALLAACYRYEGFGACLLLAGGAEEGTGQGLLAEQHALDPYFAPGARVLYALPLGGRFFLRFQADLLIPITQETLEVNRQPTWVTPPVSGALGLTLVLRFL